MYGVSNPLQLYLHLLPSAIFHLLTLQSPMALSFFPLFCIQQGLYSTSVSVPFKNVELCFILSNKKRTSAKLAFHKFGALLHFYGILFHSPSNYSLYLWLISQTQKKIIKLSLWFFVAHLEEYIFNIHASIFSKCNRLSIVATI